MLPVDADLPKAERSHEGQARGIFREDSVEHLPEACSFCRVDQGGHSHAARALASPLSGCVDGELCNARVAFAWAIGGCGGESDYFAIIFYDNDRMDAI